MEQIMLVITHSYQNTHCLYILKTLNRSLSSCGMYGTERFHCLGRKEDRL